MEPMKLAVLVVNGCRFRLGKDTLPHTGDEGIIANLLPHRECLFGILVIHQRQPKRYPFSSYQLSVEEI
jgi:hypothetical protein